MHNGQPFPLHSTPNTRTRHRAKPANMVVPSRGIGTALREHAKMVICGTSRRSQHEKSRPAMTKADQLTELTSIRDWLRYAVSRFNEAGLIYGHGTATALDEAAFLILHSLHLQIDQLDPWLDCRLLPTERRQVQQIIEARIQTRKPAPYLTNEAWMQGHSFYVDERVIVPRSYIGELLAGDLEGISPDPENVRSILDLCTGSGCLAVLAALRFPSARVEASDISQDALAVAERNVRDYGLDSRITLIQSDLFANLGGRKYDLILSNPPYVDADALAAFPPEYAAEPTLAHAGGVDGLDLARTILREVASHLNENGTLILEIGRGRERLENEFSELPFLWLDTAESRGEVISLSRSDFDALKSS
jgi:ribosomal protein L3 glutamine methyltransferase